MTNNPEHDPPIPNLQTEEMELNPTEQAEKPITSNTNLNEVLNDNEIIPEVPDQSPPDKVETNVSKILKKNLMFGEKDISVFRLYFHLSYKTEIILMIFAFIGSLGSGVTMPLMSYLTGNTVSKFSKSSSSNTEHLTDQQKQQFFVEFKDIVDEMVAKFLYIGVGVFVVNFLNAFMWTYASLRQMHHLKEKYFAMILRQEQGWFDKNNAYEFATKVQVQLEQIELGVGEKFGAIVEMIAQFVSGIVIAFTTSWELTLILLTLSPLIVLCLIFLVFSVRKALILSRKTYEIAGGIAEEVLYNIKTVVSFSNFEFEENRFNVYVDKVHKLNVECGNKFALAVGAVTFLLYCSFAVCIGYSRKLLSEGAINGNTGEPFMAGDIMTVNMSTSMAVMSVGIIMPNIMVIQEACVAASDYFTLVDRKPEINETDSTFKPPRDEVKGRIEFKNISFIYPSDVKKKKILDGLNLVFEAGKKVALVGESGCGKSTTVNLIERLYEPNEGEVLIDDVNIQKYDLKYLRSLIGYVQQEPVLFNKSIKHNLIFGRDELIEKDFNGKADEMIKDACKEAYAKEFIEKSEDKYEYIVGIRGSKLSGGQKQRIAIARAILCKPKILILDEATSALDNKSEKEVQRALDNISQKNVTTVIIAHRLSTIKNADLIYAIKDGKVLEQGTHEELLAKNGYYAGLVKSQLAQDELEQKEGGVNMKRKRSSLSKKESYDRRSYSIEDEEDNNGDMLKSEQKKKPKIMALKRMRLITLLSHIKCVVTWGTIGALATGAIHPLLGFVTASSVNVLSNPNIEEMKKDATFYACMYLLVAVGAGVFLFLKISNFRNIGSQLCCSMRKIIINKYLKLHMAYFDKAENAPGALLSKLSIDTTQLVPLVLTIFGDAIQTIAVFIVGLVLSFMYDWRLTLMSLCFLPFTVACHIMQNLAKQAGRDSYRKINIEAGGVLSECVVNTKTIYSFNFQKEAVKLYLSILDQAKKDFLRDSFVKGLLMGLGFMAMFCCKATLYHFSGDYIIDGSMSFEDMNICVSQAVSLSKGTGDGLRGIADFKKAHLAFSSLFTTIDTKAEIDVTYEGNKDKKSAKDVKGKIEFKNVTFAYPSKPDHDVLKNISFTIMPGQAAALVGYSGCGKSTIIQLLERFYDIEEGKGEILIDDVNIKEYNLLELRKKIGLVSQEPVLFKRSVYDNILYGRLDATREEVFAAAKRAAIEKFFNKQELGTKEDPVSGGEKQRLAIARAFLKNPSILLLDEATSALDKESENEVQKSIFELMKDRTSIAIAHRLSTIVDSDVIFVLENGKIVEQGKHDDLLKLGNKYATLYKYSNMS